MDILGIKLTAQQSASRSFPLQFVANFDRAVLDRDMVKLLQYCHIIIQPKYKDNWGYSSGNEVGRLCQGMPGQNDGTNTVFLLIKIKPPGIEKNDVTYGKIVCNV